MLLFLPVQDQQSKSICTIAINTTEFSMIETFVQYSPFCKIQSLICLYFAKWLYLVSFRFVSQNTVRLSQWGDLKKLRQYNKTEITFCCQKPQNMTVVIICWDNCNHGWVIRLSNNATDVLAIELFIVEPYCVT